VVQILMQRLTVLLSFVLVVFLSWRETWGLYIRLGFKHFCILSNSLFTDYLII
jgi:hypothetical protein